MFAWQFCQALHLADIHGWPRFISMQDHYNLVYREEEREMLPLCRDQRIGVIPWSPLARGRLCRPWETEPSTPRAETDEVTRTLYSKNPSTEQADRQVVERVGEIAAGGGVPRAQVALAWVLANPLVTAPIIGATKPHHLEDALAALSIQLSPDEIAALEAPYIPHPVAGFV
jgi:aryl-alcohol dehydrogenase-like predicted oxidoreductase